MQDIRSLEIVKIGQFVSTHGYKGELVIKTESFIESIPETELYFVYIDNNPVPFFIDYDSIRETSKNGIIVKLDFVDSQEQATFFIGKHVGVEKFALESEDDSGRFELEGFTVKNFGTEIGVISDFVDIEGNPLLVIEDLQKKEIYIPYSEAFIVSIDYELSIVFAELPEGLLEINA